MFKKLAATLFYGNYFYGICTVALSVETCFQLNISLNTIPYYLILFCSTVLFYIYAYTIETPVTKWKNIRTDWYFKNKKIIKFTQLILIVLSILALTCYLIKNYSALVSLSIYKWILLLIFPFIAILYYGVILSPKIKINLRKIGWIKPFIIGFVWMGVVTVYPLIFHTVETKMAFHPPPATLWFLLKNWMFITILCIMFDIKDYAADHNRQLKTFVVQIGLRKTIFYIIIPLSIIGFGSFIALSLSNHFPLIRILINSVPFILLILVAYSMHLRKSILYYLVVIDGLMLVKAICGILGVMVMQ